MVITIIIRDFYLFLVCGNKYHVVVFNANSLNVCVLRYKLSFFRGKFAHCFQRIQEIYLLRIRFCLRLHFCVKILVSFNWMDFMKIKKGKKSKKGNIGK